VSHFTVEVTVTVEVGVEASDARDALAKVNEDDMYWMEPITQGDGTIEIGPVREAT
jgi:hypothetical protein